MLFYAKIDQAFLFKTLIDLLHSNLKTICLEIDDKGIKINQIDSKTTIMVNTILYSDKFTSYTLNADKLNIGLNVMHLFKELKTIKKKDDTLELFILQSNTKELVIQISGKNDMSRLSKSIIQIQDIQIVDPEAPTGYSNTVTVTSTNFQKMIKDILNNNNTINIRSTDQGLIQFYNDISGITKKEINFGNISTREESKFSYDEVFDSKQIMKLLKITSLSSNLDIQTENDLPLCFKSNIGKTVIGFISIYIKSKKQLE